MPSYSALMPDSYAEMTPEQRRSSNAMRVEFDKTWTEAEGDPIAFMADIRRRAIETIAREGHAAYADGIADRFGP